MIILFNYDTDSVLMLDQPCPSKPTKYEIYHQGKLIEDNTAYMSAKAVHKQAITKWGYRHV